MTRYRRVKEFIVLLFAMTYRSLVCLLASLAFLENMLRLGLRNIFDII